MIEMVLEKQNGKISSNEKAQIFSLSPSFCLGCCVDIYYLIEFRTFSRLQNRYSISSRRLLSVEVYKSNFRFLRYRFWRLNMPYFVSHGNASPDLSKAVRFRAARAAYRSDKLIWYLVDLVYYHGDDGIGVLNWVKPRTKSRIKSRIKSRTKSRTKSRIKSRTSRPKPGESRPAASSSAPGC